MSKKPKTSRHRIPTAALVMKSDPIDERYQLEVDRSSAKLEAHYQRAAKALRRAQAKVERAKADTKSRSVADIERLESVVLQRRSELLAIKALMMPGTYSSRDSRRRLVRHESAGFDINLSAKGSHK